MYFGFIMDEIVLAVFFGGLWGLGWLREVLVGMFVILEVGYCDIMVSLLSILVVGLILYNS